MAKKYGRGQNPASHHNKPRSGKERKNIMISREVDNVLTEVGSGSRSDGLEIMMRELVAQAQGFALFTWGATLDSDLGLNEPADRLIKDTEANQEVCTWAKTWLRMKEWDLLGPGGEMPPTAERSRQAFLQVDIDLREKAKDLGDKWFLEKHPGQESAPRLSAAQVIACWELC